jgi:hypothetical protein
MTYFIVHQLKAKDIWEEEEGLLFMFIDGWSGDIGFDFVELLGLDFSVLVLECDFDLARYFYHLA